MLVDRFGRIISYVRISVTDRCNLRCRYCVEGRIPFVPHDEILRYEELVRLARIFAELGVSKMRITGGEPLIKKDIAQLIGKIRAIPGITDIGLTTNGVHLAAHLADLRAAGLKRVNISLDTLKRHRFAFMTGVDAFDEVWESIDLAVNAGLDPVKINTVVISGFNDDEVLDFAELARTRKVEVRFIEFMPFGDCGLWKNSQIITTGDLKELIRTKYVLQPMHDFSSGPAKTYGISGGVGRIGFISPLSSHLCRKCNRIRVVARGAIRPCLLSQREYDVKELVRGGATDEEIRQFVKEVVGLKPEGKEEAEQIRKRQMNLRQIGG